MKEILFKIDIEGQEELQSLDSLLNETATSFGQLESKKDKLEQAFKQAQFGTPEFNKLQAELRETNTLLVQIDETVSDITLADKVQGFVQFGQAAAGAFTIATGAASLFGDSLGVSEEEAAEAEARFTKLIAVLQGLEAISAAFSKDNKLFNALAQIRTGANGTAFSLGRIPIFAKASQAAVTAFGQAGRVALIATGIGAFVVALGLVVAYWEDIKKGVESLLPVGVKFKDVFMGALNVITTGIKNTIAAIGLLATGKVDEAAEKMKAIGTAYADGVAESQQETAFENTIKSLDELDKANRRSLELAKARGDETTNLERQILADKIKRYQTELALLDESDEKYAEVTESLKDAQNDLAVFEAKLVSDRAKKDAEALKKRQEEYKAYTEKVKSLGASINQAQKEFDSAELSGRRAALDKLFTLQVDYARLTITDKQKLNVELLRLDQDYYKQLDAIVNANAAAQLETTKVTAAERNSVTLAAIDNEIAATENALDSIDTSTQEGKSAYNTLLGALQELNLKRVAQEEAYTLFLIEENRKRKQVALDAIELGSDPNAFAERERQKTEIDEQAEAERAATSQRFANQRVKIEQDTAKKIAAINKDLSDKTQDQAEKDAAVRREALKNNITAVREFADVALTAAEAFISVQRTRIDQQLKAVQDNIRNIEATLDAANERREEALAKADEFQSQLDESQDRLSQLQSEQTNVANQLANAIASGNTAAIASLTAQQNELAKRIAVERRNRQSIDESKRAAQSAAEAERENIRKLNEERKAAAEDEKRIQQEQIELQKQQSRVNKVAAIVNMGLAIAGLAATSGTKDPTFGVATIAAITALAGVLTAVVLPLVNGEGFAEGGFTGKGSGSPDSSGYKVAGVVHEGEYVIPKRMVDSPEFKPVIGQLEAARTRGYATGGFVTNTATTGTDGTLAALMAIASRPVQVAVTDIVKETNSLNVTVAQNRL